MPPYPEHVGPDPEQTSREHFTRFRRNIARFLFGSRETRRMPMVEEHAFTMSDPARGIYYSVHHEKYGTPRPFGPRRLLPHAPGDASIVMVPERKGKLPPTYYVAVAYPPNEDDPEQKLNMDLLGVRVVFDKEPGTKHYELDERTDIYGRFFAEDVMLPKGSEVYSVRMSSLEEMLDDVEPEAFDRSREYASRVASLTVEARTILMLAGAY